MHKITISIIFILIINSVFAQSINDAVFFTPSKQINKFHTIGDLEALKKGELIALYQDRVEEIMTILPLLSLTNEAGVRLKDIGIKEDSRHVKILKSNKESTTKNLVTTKKAIEELVPYADTGKIIWTILYYEEVIKKMRIGSNGSF
ncbi:hypothetical protein D1816_12515 [Aquimarina sp. AD10]|uniref:hypothetical protein n=1 Tax=Aquimarina sp. AD10 TaxID=1714849 RepID=UPI000E49A5CE|nr:hypothetical protein [Aquimarina sp. AD10]AXT61134.1 hypothetical protein D1816_12515 [Aquimarina sp. AD10]RKN02250.1 hypothetical protein D7033_02095 [Aquimarina sp. AD10]